jgi:hypothetical protein
MSASLALHLETIGHFVWPQRKAAWLISRRLSLSSGQRQPCLV